MAAIKPGNIITMILGLVLTGLVITLIVMVSLRKGKNGGGGRSGGNGTGVGVPGNYKKIFDVSNTKDLRKAFLLDNPGSSGVNGDGGDPTGGVVNGDTTWQEIPQGGFASKLISDYEDGIKINIETDGKGPGGTSQFRPGNVGSVRLLSRKLYKGGLFIFDIEHCPVGCGVWPALWLNGFVGVPDQYHVSPNSPLFDPGMAKLWKVISQGKENFTRLCTKETAMNPVDKFMSLYRGQPTYVAAWPTGGEFDILEQNNFSNKNKLSLHTGPYCEITNEYAQPDWSNPPSSNNKSYQLSKLQNCCGQTWSGFGEYSGCKNSKKWGRGSDGTTVTLPNGLQRYACETKDASGLCQIDPPDGTYGPLLNLNGGGVYALQWTPNNRILVWFWPRKYFSQKILEKSGGPLSNNPDPSSWPEKQMGDIPNIRESGVPYNILLASYILNDPNAMTQGCDINYQGITINITICGGWGAGAIPWYCSQGGKSGSGNCNNYVTKCLQADPDNVTNPGGVDKENGCFDGAYSENARGRFAEPVFYKEAFFKLRKIRVFQNPDTDDNVW
jgi:hypothetical protein